MKLGHLFLALILSLSICFPVMANETNTDPLFISVTTDQGHRAKMGIGFGKSQYERGHFVTIFLNDKGVLLASTKNQSMYAQHQEMLKSIIDQGGQVLICPMCLKHYGLKKSDLLAGIQVSNPEITGNALFSDNIRTLVW